MKFSIIIPTCNAGPLWHDVVNGVLMQTSKPECVFVVDSESTDGTAVAAKAAGFSVQEIKKATFDHGATRQMGVNSCHESDIVVFLTHDSVLVEKDAIQKLLKVFEDPRVGAAYGRQLPRRGSNAIEAHSRLYNYTEKSLLKSLDNRNQLGYKTVFNSNSFSAYRRSALMAVGGFPHNVILSEDMHAASKMIMAGWALAYAADAKVYHSHNFSYANEFQRYFDIGVFHTREKWIKDEFGGVGGEGRRFVLSELRYLLKNNPLLIPSCVLRTSLKMSAFWLGKMERFLPVKLKKHLSMNTGFWDKEAELVHSLDSPSVSEDHV